MTAIGGTQHVVVTDKADLDGVFGVWYGKGPGSIEVSMPSNTLA